MKFRILRYSAMTRREIYKSIAKWVLFSLVLLVSYTIEVTMPFASWQPYLTLTTAVAVSFFSEELSGVVFAAFAGMMHDLAMGSLFGFTSIWLTPCCLFVTLLVVNLIHRNILNFLWMNLTAVILVQSAELLLKYLIWRNPDIDVVLINYVLPALIATVILSAPLYLIIRQINKKLGVENNTDDILTAFEDVEDDEDKVRY
ncbi:MAG: rod shape-determining protein MreD [[Eubacterium] siraeum]|nr:rod shape-determining protein MreD [[Eubacterium] siraeum]